MDRAHDVRTPRGVDRGEVRVDPSEILALSPSAIVQVDRSGCVVFANDAFAALLGRPPDRITGEPFDALLAPGATSPLERAARSPGLASDGTAEAVTALAGRHGPVLVEVAARRASNGSLIASVAPCATAPARLAGPAPAPRRLEPERYRPFIEHSQNAMIVFDLDCRVMLANEAACRLFGYAPETFVGLDEEHLLPRHEPGRVGASREAWSRGELTVRRYRGHRLRRDGVMMEVDLSVSPLVSGGTVVGALVEYRDVTELMETQRALIESEERLRAVLETAQDGIVLADLDGTITLVNRACCEMLGCLPGDLVGLSGFDLLGTEGAAVRPAGPAPPAATEELQRTTRYIRRRDGAMIHAEISYSLFRIGDRVTGWLAEIRDLGEEDRLRTQLLQAQKSEALGTLVAGVAHDFNNLLTAIGGSIELAAAEFGEDHRWLRNARLGSERATELVRQLLQFSRRDAPDRRRVDLVPLVRETVGLARQTFDRRIALAVEIEGEPPDVLADAGQVQQVLMNLLLNARDAVLARAAGALEGYRGDVAVSLRAGRWTDDRGEEREGVVVTVADNGAGMSEEVRQRVFDPFFTTKPTGHGTGLGLATAYGIVTEHGGVIDVDSAEGNGTTFTLCLPLADVTAARRERIVQVPGATSPEAATSGAVLIADDEPIILELAQVALREAGYEVVAVAGGAEALRAAAERPFDLAVLDVNMPSPNGWETLSRLRAEHPALPVMMSSGYATPEEALDRGAVGLIEKPYRPDRLIAAVRAHLAARATLG